MACMQSEQMPQPWPALPSVLRLTLISGEGECAFTRMVHLEYASEACSGSTTLSPLPLTRSKHLEHQRGVVALVAPDIEGVQVAAPCCRCIQNVVPDYLQVLEGRACHAAGVDQAGVCARPYSTHLSRTRCKPHTAMRCTAPHRARAPPPCPAPISTSPTHRQPWRLQLLERQETHKRGAAHAARDSTCKEYAKRRRRERARTCAQSCGWPCNEVVRLLLLLLSAAHEGGLVADGGQKRAIYAGARHGKHACMHTRLTHFYP